MRYSYTFSLARSTGELAPVRCRVSFAGKRVEIRLGLSVLPQRWRNGRATGDGALEINRAMASLSAKIDEYFARCVSEGREPSVAEVKALGGAGRDPAGEHRVTRLIDRFQRECGPQSGWAQNTYSKFRTLCGHIDAYDRLADIGEVTTEWLRGFCSHLECKAGMRNSTIVKTMKLVRWFLNWAEREGLYHGGAQHAFKLRLRQTDGTADIIYLEWPEFEALYCLDLPEGVLKAARDVFCFQCLTGLRYSDVSALKSSDVYNGKVRVIMHKTAGLVEVELNRRAMEILQRWEGRCADGLALPVTDNAKYNKRVHEVCRLAGLDRPYTRIWYKGGTRHEETVPLWQAVSSHAGRRTFVVHALTLGIPAEVIMRWTGHRDFDAMRPYMKIVDDLKKSEMRKFDQ